MADGPFADDLVIGRPLPAAPSITLDAGLAAYYQALVGDPAQLPLSDVHAERVTGSAARPVNSALLLHVVIGQSTPATRVVVANLFYRGVVVHHPVRLGDTITTTVTPVARAYSSRAPRRGKVLLAVEAVDQTGRVVVSMERLALLPLRDPEHDEPVGDVGSTVEPELAAFAAAVPPSWRLDRLAAHEPPTAGWTAVDPLRDAVSDAQGLVRLTQNLAAAHRDPARGQRGRRLVYGGHVIGLAQASLFRVLPGAVTVLGWRGCDHLAPTFEHDLLEVETTVEEVLPVAGGLLVAARVVATAQREAGPTAVLDFRPAVLLAPGPAPEEQTHDQHR